MKPPRNKPLETYAKRLGLYVLQLMLDTPESARFKAEAGGKILGYMKKNKLVK